MAQGKHKRKHSHQQLWKLNFSVTSKSSISPQRLHFHPWIFFLIIRVQIKGQGHAICLAFSADVEEMPSVKRSVRNTIYCQSALLIFLRVMYNLMNQKKKVFFFQLNLTHLKIFTDCVLETFSVYCIYETAMLKGT